MLPYKTIALLVLLALYSGGVFWLGGEHSRKVAAQDKLDSVITQVEANNRATKKLQHTLDTLPKSEGTIREIVHTNPANCSMPQPVVDGLQGAIDKANAARKVSSDS